MVAAVGRMVGIRHWEEPPQEGMFHVVYLFNVAGIAKVLHLAAVSDSTKQSIGVQSAFIFRKEGHIFGTMKQPEMTREQLNKSWLRFCQLARFEAEADVLIGEMPRRLALYYLKAYKGIRRSTREPLLGGDGMRVLECDLTTLGETMGQKTKYGVGVILGIYGAAFVAVSSFGADASAVFAAIPMAAAVIVSTHMIAREISSGIAKFTGHEKPKV